MQYNSHMLYTCYLRDGIVYVPAVGKRGGVYVTMEPVAVVPVADSEGVRRAFAEVIGNKRYFYDVGDQAGAAALNRAFTALLRPGLMREARQSILDQLDVFTRTDPAEKRDRTNGAVKWTDEET
jgi:hypothetical protein